MDGESLQAPHVVNYAEAPKMDLVELNLKMYPSCLTPPVKEPLKRKHGPKINTHVI